ncbi:hypothetical protein JW887_06995 [Candidatus Dojkabacteria bacterium]|nr:hypothetical protein [Candidatus Dojkabacteria bacterium]
MADAITPNEQVIGDPFESPDFAGKRHLSPIYHTLRAFNEGLGIYAAKGSESLPVFGFNGYIDALGNICNRYGSRNKFLLASDVDGISNPLEYMSTAQRANVLGERLDAVDQTIQGVGGNTLYMTNRQISGYRDGVGDRGLVRLAFDSFLKNSELLYVFRQKGYRIFDYLDDEAVGYCNEAVAPTVYFGMDRQLFPFLHNSNPQIFPRVRARVNAFINGFINQAQQADVIVWAVDLHGFSGRSIAEYMYFWSEYLGLEPRFLFHILYQNPQINWRSKIILPICVLPERS